ncbi:unnamed protein product [Bursaphelenchus xylophilus]|uniref:E3 ubiquitin-protein transferase MAEA n=1 Tax=Bursaphelenchus xylophilus TaxID=6326 RepID=A0A1I7SDP8_BURXY|nr:unnamed protein product [Bursaphelenchus xylophilus]CAG9084455.1 unnamed protein product [Bursaphelenchus xylophilus]
MFFALFSLIEFFVFILNGFAIVNRERVLNKYLKSREHSFDSQSQDSAVFRLVQLIISIQTVLRVPLIFLNSLIIVSKRSKNALTDLLKKSDRSIDVEPVRVEFSQVTDRLRKFLKSFDEIVSEEENAAQTFGSRTKYLKQGFSSDPAISSAFRKQRTNRFIIDYFLRAGYFETAQKLAEYVGIDNIDRNVFHVAKQVEDGLQRHDLSICLNWVLDNRSKLHRLHSNFETEVRVQQLIELIKNGQRQESINFIRATFGGPDKWTNETLLQVMGLLAFGPATGVSSYQKLVISERWEQILDMFREENAKIFRLSPQSAFSVCLQVGLAAYKTPFCKNNPDSRCIICRDLYDLAYGLPFSNVKNSRLICAYSGESLDDENNRPVMLPNGQVYGERAINQLVRDNVIMCPKSSEFFPADKLQRVYVL